jgi:DNA-binding XRE family transcriptional regulator
MKTSKRISKGPDLPLVHQDKVESVEAEEVINPVLEQTEEEMIGIRSRFLEFIDLANPSKVAERIGDAPHKYYHLRAGRTFPSLETIMRVAAAFPDTFDKVYVLTGKRLSKVAGPPDYVADAVSALEAKIRQDMEKQYLGLLQEKDARIQSIEADKTRLWELLGKNEGATNQDPVLDPDFALMRHLFAAKFGV